MENTQKYEQKPLTGTIWMELQTKVGKNGEFQVYSGSALIEGKEYWISAVPRTTQTGKNLLSLSFREKQPRPEAPRNQTASEPMPVMNGLAQFVDEKPQATEIPLDTIPF